VFTIVHVLLMEKKEKVVVSVTYVSFTNRVEYMPGPKLKDS